MTGEKLLSIQVAISPRFYWSGSLSKRRGGDGVKEQDEEDIFFSLLQSSIDKNIRGYYDRRKIVVNLGCNFPSLLLVGPFIQKEGMGWSKGGGWRRSLFQPGTKFTFFYRTWKSGFRIQVIIYPIHISFLYLHNSKYLGVD